MTTFRLRQQYRQTTIVKCARDSVGGATASSRRRAPAVGRGATLDVATRHAVARQRRDRATSLPRVAVSASGRPAERRWRQHHAPGQPHP